MILNVIKANAIKIKAETTYMGIDIFKILQDKS